MQLERQAFDLELKFDDGGSEGQVEGYGSVFGLLDRGADIIEKGAFKASLAEWRKKKSMPSMLWQHDSWQPIGVWTSIEEDDKGLKVAGQLLLEIERAKEAHILAKAKAIKGLSIGYRTLDYDIDRTTGVRRIKKVELWEISLVTFPMLPEAQISGVKGLFDAKALERAFRCEGLSNNDAKAAVAAVRKLQPTGDDLAEADEAKSLLMDMRRLRAALAE